MFQLSRRLLLGGGNSSRLVGEATKRLCSTNTGINTKLDGPQDRIEKSINQVTLLGRTGGDAEMRGSEIHPVTQFSLATHVNFQRGEETIQNTVWHRISVFRPGLRESVYQNLKKGQRVLVQGRIGYFDRRDPNDDSVVSKTASIVAHEVIFLK